MKLKTRDLTPRIGTEVETDLETLLDGSIARDLRALLDQRGVLVFRGIGMTDEHEIGFRHRLGEGDTNQQGKENDNFHLNGFADTEALTSG